mgnify:CR=1 FL=1|tara:strand:+ start:1065 stop:1421 length:357 start_codon:yes stop_codon:yes gene_type:complete
MGELLDGFITQIEDESTTLSLKELMTDKEIGEWELLVKVFNELEITHIADSLKKINKYYNLNRSQEMSILALVKMLEMMVAATRDRIMAGGTPDAAAMLEMSKNSDSISFDNTGGMFG